MSRHNLQIEVDKIHKIDFNVKKSLRKNNG